MHSFPAIAKTPRARFEWQNVIAFVVVCACTVTFMATVDCICTALIAPKQLQDHDFISYWASAKQIRHHANPYDGDAILHLERLEGFAHTDKALIMRNLPPALLLVLPFGFLSLRVGNILWGALLLGCLIVSVKMLWTMHGRPKNRRHLLAYTFGPALICVICGQTGLVALLGLVLFLRLHRSHPFWAGVSLWLCALKPHLFLPFWAVLILWTVATRSYRVLLGLSAALGASSLAVFFLDPSAWSQYRQMMHGVGVGQEFIPCWSTVFRLGIDPHAMWLQYVFAGAGTIWAMDYYRRHRDAWDWMEHGALLMLVSVLVSPYAWITDQALVIPALLQGAYRTSRNSIALILLASAATECGLLVRNPMHSAKYLWTTPVWLAWYLWAVHRGRIRHPNPALLPADM